MALPLSAIWDDPGGYYSVFFPTASEGAYTFRIYGDIGGTEIGGHEDRVHIRGSLRARARREPATGAVKD